MVSIRKLVHALALLAVISLLVAAPTNAAQDGLISASVAGDLPRVKSLLAANADVDAKGLDGMTGLIVMASKRMYARGEERVRGHLEVVQSLLAAKADVSAKDANGYTALFRASQLDVVQALLAAKADVKANVGGFTALSVASARGDQKVVQALLAADADVNAKGLDGSTALIMASSAGH